MKFIEKICWLWQWDKDKRHAWKEARRYTTHYNGRYIYRWQEGGDLILRALQAGKPCSIARFGASELEVLDYAFRHRHTRHMVFPEYAKARIQNGSGFFSNTDEFLTRFASEMFQAVRNLDILVTWRYRTDIEKKIVETYNPTAGLVDLSALSIVPHERPWTQYLAGKKVLVIHPFEKTIRLQYAKRAKLFKNPLTLPDFDLQTLKAVQGLCDGEETRQYANWFDALHSMCRAIDDIHFDIALIGAGAYGMPLADYVKRRGKQAVHVAGELQLLFGIIGERWERDWPAFCTEYVNEHWVRPLPEDTPKSLEKIKQVETNNTYW